MSNISNKRPDVAFRSKAVAVASWSTAPVKNLTNPCTSMWLARNHNRSRKQKSSAKISSPMFASISNTSKPTHHHSGKNPTQMDTEQMQTEALLMVVMGETEIEITAIHTKATATILPMPAHHLLQHLVPLPRRRPPTMHLNTLSTMPANPVEIHTRLTVAIRIMLHITNTTSRLPPSSNNLPHRRLGVMQTLRPRPTIPLHRHLHPQEAILLSHHPQACEQNIGWLKS